MNKTDLRVRCSAAAYDAYTADHVLPYDLLLIERLASEFGRHARPDGLVVDVGTGTAQLLVRMAREPRFASLQFLGIDHFDDMVEQARASIHSAGLSQRIHVVQGDAHEVPLPSSSAEFVISRSTLHHWRDPVTAIREIDRILKPGGVAIIHDVRRDASDEALEAFNAQRLSIGLTPCNTAEKYTADEIRQMLRSAGVAARALVFAPRSGAAALGFELRIEAAS